MEETFNREELNDAFEKYFYMCRENPEDFEDNALLADESEIRGISEGVVNLLIDIILSQQMIVRFWISFRENISLTYHSQRYM